MKEARSLFADGQAYEQNMGRWSRLAGAAFLDWLALPGDLGWLDVGCGNGAFTEVLIDRTAPRHVTAIDPSEGQLAYAQTRLQAKLAQFRVGDAMALPFSDGSFDVAVMALVISFLPDAQKAVAEMTRVVRPRGSVATYMWDAQGGGSPFEPIYAAMKSLDMTAPRTAFAANSNQDNMRALWERAGLSDVETHVIRISVEFENFADFWRSSNAPAGILHMALDGMSPNAREQLETRLRERVPMRPDGRIAYEAFANAVKGQTRG
jgi:ubiquinone/menaquinone biosynthesis C-methylase UbiE